MFPLSGDGAFSSRHEIAAACCQTHWPDVVSEFYRRVELKQGDVVQQHGFDVQRVGDDPPHLLQDLVGAGGLQGEAAEGNLDKGRGQA